MNGASKALPLASLLVCSVPGTAAAQAVPGTQIAELRGTEGAPSAVDARAPQDGPAQGDIVVTAQKRSQTLLDVPISVTAQTGAQLVSKGINDVQDLVKVTPGLSFVESGRGVPVFSVRGVGFFDAAIGARPTVSVYIDEAPLPFLSWRAVPRLTWSASRC